MDITFQQGYPDYIGKRQAFVASGAGPTSYTQIVPSSSGVSGGDIVNFPLRNNYIDALNQAFTVDGLYRLDPYANRVGSRAIWRYRWIVVSTGAEVAAGTNLSGSSANINGFCGKY